jgi:hypothetical protein
MATTDPKETPGRKEWDGTAEATWDIPKAEFTSQKVTRKFAGVRKRFLRIEAGKHRKTQRRFKVTIRTCERPSKLCYSLTLIGDKT